jgi:hypothetical protein
MIEFYSEIWPAFVSILKRFGSIETLDILTGYLGAGAHKALKDLGKTIGSGLQSCELLAGTMKRRTEKRIT